MHAPIDSVLRDFALVSRIEDPKTGQPGLVVAGLSATGTAAATEFVISPTYFYRFARQAPKGWQDHDFQIVISIDLVDGKSGEPHLLMYDIH